MMRLRRWRLLLSLLLAMTLTLCCAGTLLAQTSSGPKKGALVIAGGEFGPGVIERFVALAGGPDANFVYIPTAASSIKLPSGFIYDPPDNDIAAANTAAFEQELAQLFGVKRIKELHTRERATANSASFVAPIRRANGVWLSSGNAGRLAHAYLDTLTERELAAVLARGG